MNAKIPDNEDSVVPLPSESCYSRVAFITLIVCLFLSSRTAATKIQDPFPPPLPDEAAVLFAEACHLRQTLGDKIWPGWSAVSSPMIYVTADWEYAVGFPNTLKGFTPLPTSASLAQTVQVRKRTMNIQSAASFPYEGVEAIVMGTPEALEKSPAQWVLTSIHEMFHVLQASRGGIAKVARLKIGSETDPSWQLNFPFPYRDEDVMRLIHLQGYPLYLASIASDDASVKYNLSAAVEAIKVYRSYLERQSTDHKFYNYSRFQESTEGIALYTEYRMAEATATDHYQPTEAFQKLTSAGAYQKAWSDDYERRTFLIKHAGRAAQSRTTFYHLGFGKGLVLDRLMPVWKTRYFSPDVWLDDLLIASLSSSQ